MWIIANKVQGSHSLSRGTVCHRLGVQPLTPKGQSWDYGIGVRHWSFLPDVSLCPCEFWFVLQESFWISGWMGSHHGERELFRAAPHWPSISNRPSSTEPSCCPNSRTPQRFCVIPHVIPYDFVFASMRDMTAVGLQISDWKLSFYIHSNLKNRAESDSNLFLFYWDRTFFLFGPYNGLSAVEIFCIFFF